MFGRKKKKDEDSTQSVNLAEDEIDQIMDEAEEMDSGEDEDGAGSKTRSKNTKVAFIAVIALMLIVGIYFGTQQKDKVLELKDKLFAMVGLKKEAPAPVAQEEDEEDLDAPLPEEEYDEETMDEGLDENLDEEYPPEEGDLDEPEEENVAQEVKPGAKPAKEEATTGPAAEETVAEDGIDSSSEAPPKKVAAKAPKAAKAPPEHAASMSSSGGYAIQIGTFSVKRNAIKLIKKYTGKGYKAYGISITGPGRSHVIYAGPFYSRPEAEDAAREMKKYGVPSARVKYDYRSASYKVYAGSFSSESASRRAGRKARDLGYTVGSEIKRGHGAMTVVYIGNFDSQNEAEKVRRKLPKGDIPSSIIVKRPEQG